MTRIEHSYGGMSKLANRPMLPTCRLAVVIPYLDEAAHLPACLHSLATAIDAIDTRSVEVVLVDNGSVDGSADIAANWAASNRDGWPVHLLQEPRQGIGWARSAGAAVAVARAANRAYAREPAFWVLSTDSDCTLPEDYLARWSAHMSAAKAPILVGEQSFGDEFSAAYPVADLVFRQLGAYRNVLENIFYVVNTDGFNHAVERSAYAVVGPYRQPVTYTAGGPRNHAGEDWDLGTRARAAGLRPVRVGSTVLSSPRRLVADPREYFTGAAYEGEFRRVDTVPAADLSAEEHDEICTVGRSRLLLHYACKPFLVDPALQHSLIHRMPARLRPEIGRWMHQARSMDLIAHRNEFILGLLTDFWRHHADHLAAIAHGAEDDR